MAAALPRTLAPQLATGVSAVPAQGRWIFEDKFDGYRLLACIDGGVPRLLTRGGHDWSAKMPQVVHALGELSLGTAWLDGEVIVRDSAQGGSTSFHKLQTAFDGSAAGRADSGLVYMLFDMPYFEGHDLRGVPLEARRELLQQMLQSRLHDDDASAGSLGFSAALGVGDAELGARLLRKACAAQREGIIAKRVDTPYRGVRDGSWLKLKCRLRQEFVVGGYALRGDDHNAVGSLVLGVHDDARQLRHAGSVGTGWSTDTARALLQRLKKLPRGETPFAGEKPAHARWRTTGTAQVHWVRPALVVEVKFAEWTPAGHIRHASFVGVRSDRPARNITREDVRDPTAPVAVDADAPPQVPKPSPTRLTSLRITHPERVIDAKSGHTKQDLVRYYESVSTWMLPHLTGRPVALLRAPGGIAAPVFFQKHAPDGSIPGVVTLDAALWPGHEPLLEVRSVQGLMGAAQMNTLEFHTWNARVKSLAKPDMMVFDLDPGEGVSWPAICEGAVLMRALLQELGLRSWLKTSGGKGLHLVVPIAARWPFDTVKAFAKALVQHLAQTIPDRFVAKSGPANRRGRIFVDYLRNGEGATTVAPYSVRARPGLGVAMPIDWDELPEVTGAAQWTVKNATDRVSQLVNDPWAAMAGVRQSLSAPLKLMKLPAALR